MSQNIVDDFNRKLEEKRAQQRAEAVPMNFAGFPCKVIRLPWTVFVSSRRMPDRLTNALLAGPGEAQPAPEFTTEEVKEGELFKQTTVCRVLVEPRVTPEGTPGEGEYLYADLLETAPAFISAVFLWVLRACPIPKGEEAEGLTADDLERFPDGAGQRASTGGGDNGKGEREKPKRVDGENRKRTRRP